MKEALSTFWKKSRRWLPGVVISVVALFLVFRLASWQDIGTALGKINPLILAASAGFTFLFLVTRAMAWRTILEKKAGFSQCFWGLNVGYLLNNLLPLRAGEFGRAFLVGQTSGLGAMHVFSTIIIERAFDLAFAAGLMLSTLPMALAMEEARPVSIITLVLVILGLGLLYLMARFNEKAHAWITSIGERIPLVKRFIVPQLDALLRGLRVLVKPDQFLLVVVWIALSWLMGIFNYYIMILAFAPQAPFWWGAFVDAVLAMGIAVPFRSGSPGCF
ncbi:MAG: lysylphosphatidylglycerol synthase transmembrane domain-containing protein [Anaerolineaceae bacterium]